MEPSKPTNFAQDRRRYLDTLITVIPVGPWCALLFAWSAAVAIPAMATEDEKHKSEITPQALCPATPSGHKENSIGCPESVLDADNDDIADHQDQCLNSVANQGVLASGCSQAKEDLANSGADLAELDDLSSAEREVASAIDELCPRLILADNQGPLMAEQKDLRDACANLKNKDSTVEQQTVAIRVITPEQISNRTDITPTDREMRKP